MKNVVSLLLLVLALGACQQKTQDGLVTITEDVQREVTMHSAEGVMLDAGVNRKVTDFAYTPDESGGKSSAVDKKKIIHDGDMTIRVKHVQEMKRRVDTLISKHQAYYANESFNNNEREASFSLRVRIPCNQFDQLITCLEGGYGEVLYKEIRARDVTDQFIDLETRLENKHNYLSRYKALLKEAKTVKDILQIQEKIRGLEEEIESTTGRLKYLSDQVDYSTLYLTLTEQKNFQYKPDVRDRFGEKLKQSLSRGWFGFVDFVLFLIKIWPIWLILCVGVISLKIRSKSRKND